MLHDLANDDGSVALKLAAENREGWRHSKRMSKTCSNSRRLLIMVTMTLVKVLNDNVTVRHCAMSQLLYKHILIMHCK